MKQLIEAFTIFEKYNTALYPIWGNDKSVCVLVDPVLVSTEDIARLAVLQFLVHDGEDGDCFETYLFRAETK